MSIKTAGDLRGFLAGVLLDIRNGKLDVEEANAISKVAAQITHSLAVEVNTALQLQRMGKDHPVAGTMLLTNGDAVTGVPMSLDVENKFWCEQCDKRVTPEAAAACTSRFCKVKPA